MPPAAVLLVSANGAASLMRTSSDDEKSEREFTNEDMMGLEDISLSDDSDDDEKAVSTIVAAANIVCETVQRMEMERGHGDCIAKSHNHPILRRPSSSESTYPGSSMSDGSSSSSSSVCSKQVHFPQGRAVQVMETIHLFDYTLQEAEATWYSKRDMRIFKRERKELGKLVDQGIMAEEILLGAGDDVRGIESATSAGNKVRHKHIVDGIDSVMVEQDLQYEDCKWNADAIAYIYHVACEGSVRDAHKRALADEQVIMEDLQRIRQEFATN